MAEVSLNSTKKVLSPERTKQNNQFNINAPWRFLSSGMLAILPCFAVYGLYNSIINVSTELKCGSVSDKIAGKLVTSNIASAHNQWYSSFIPLIGPYDVWRNVNSRIFVRHWRSFQQVCRYVYYVSIVKFFQTPSNNHTKQHQQNWIKCCPTIIQDVNRGSYVYLPWSCRWRRAVWRRGLQGWGDTSLRARSSLAGPSSPPGPPAVSCLWKSIHCHVVLKSSFFFWQT